jgi:hypothetical protein
MLARSNPSKLFGQRHRMRAITHALPGPQRISGGFDRGGRGQAFLQHGDVGGVAAHCDQFDSARAALSGPTTKSLHRFFSPASL